MDLDQFFQRDHTRVSGLFDKLSDTSEGAVKTRERLFNQLKSELEAHTAAVEEVLYPVLKRHKETKDLVPARKELNEVDKTLQELDRMPKEDETFLKKAGELKRIAERHLREEERRIVPALKRVIDRDETEEIARKLAAEKREELQEGNAPGAAVSRGAQAAADGLRVVTERGADAARQGAEIARRGSEAALQGSQRLAESVAGQAQQTGRNVMEAAQTYSEIAKRATEGLQAFAGSTRISAEGARQVQQAWMELLANTMRRGTQTSQELLRCSNPQQVAEVQRRFVEESWQEWFQGGAEMLRLSTRVLQQMAKPMEEGASRFERHEEDGRRAAAAGSR